MSGTPERAERLSLPREKEVSYIKEQDDFSLVLGGPTYQILRRLHLEGGQLEHLQLRLPIITLATWLPLLLISTFDSSGGSLGQLSFLRDVEVHIRFLVALPVLVAGETIVHARLRPAVRRFVEQRLILPEDLARFHRAIDSAIRLRNSALIECGLLLLVYAIGPWLWSGRVGIANATWYAQPGGRWHLTHAGFWYVFVSIPVFQFILLRWYFRLFIWFRFLWQVSRLNLHLVPTHPDRSAGLAFLGKHSYAFGPILFAQGALLAGVIATRVLYGGESLLSFKLQIAGFVAFFVLVVLGPLVMFAPAMSRAKRKGLADYGLIAQRYVDRFERRWVLEDPSIPSEELLGAADIQSLADLGNSYAMVREMHLVPFGLDDIIRLVAATAVPLLPLVLTILSPEELIIRVIKVVL